jgi:hypothetical protein
MPATLARGRRRVRTARPAGTARRVRPAGARRRLARLGALRSCATCRPVGFAARSSVRLRARLFPCAAVPSPPRVGLGSTTLWGPGAEPGTKPKRAQALLLYNNNNSYIIIITWHEALAQARFGLPLGSLLSCAVGGALERGWVPQQAGLNAPYRQAGPCGPCAGLAGGAGRLAPGRPLARAGSGARDPAGRQAETGSSAFRVTRFRADDPADFCQRPT